MCHELVYYFWWDSVSHIQCSSNKAYFLDCIDKIEDFWGWREVWRVKKRNPWGKITFGGARLPSAWLLSAKKGVVGQCFAFRSKTWARTIDGVHHKQTYHLQAIYEKKSIQNSRPNSLFAAHWKGKSRSKAGWRIRDARSNQANNLIEALSFDIW